MGDSVPSGSDRNDLQDSTGDALASLIACPVCDTLHRDSEVPDGAQARCHRCGTVLLAPRAGAMTQIVLLALTAAILMVAAIFFPFLDLQAGGQHREGSVIGAILAFSDGWMMPLSLAVGALVVLLPLTRLLAIVYTLAPMAFGWRPAPHAERAFRLAEGLRPWAMAEVFIVGVAVALVKIAGLATVTPGFAFWAFALLVLITALKDTFMCRLSVWKTLERRRAP
ncbi:MAG: paraquat-inducible protein A [Rhodobacteraceae bacterium]|nr:paraquat-inducible protein A [Paracoccaceae bacterium]